MPAAGRVDDDNENYTQPMQRNVENVIVEKCECTLSITH